MSRLIRRIPALAAAVVAVLAVTGAVAQVTTPVRGSALRAAILDAVRPMVEAEVGKPVEFVVNDMRVLGEWAFVDLKPQRPGGGTIEYIYSRYQGAVDAGAFDNQVVALLRQTPRGWLVYQYSLGATDVVWYGWWMYYPVRRRSSRRIERGPCRAPASRPRPGRYMLPGAGTIQPWVAPPGIWMTAIRPTSGTSQGGRTTLPPASTTFFSRLSRSSTAT
jgi:hypothetical protein